MNHGLWYDQPGPRLWQRSNLNVKWVGTDSAENYLRNLENPSTNMLLQEGGWLDPNRVLDYCYNFQGFRCAEFDDRVAGLALGCSCTEGIGVEVQHSWPLVLSDMMGMHVWNLGISGASNDTVFRMAHHYIDLLRPRFVAILNAPAHRLEINSGGDNWHPVGLHIPDSINDSFLKTWFSHDANSDYNSIKNNLAVEKICDAKRIPCVIFSSDHMVYDRLARDCVHPGVASHRDIAVEFYSILKGRVQ